jgi:hypothetical protein
MTDVLNEYLENEAKKRTEIAIQNWNLLGEIFIQDKEAFDVIVNGIMDYILNEEIDKDHEILEMIADECDMRYYSDQ